jgi:hypothetical protein
MDKSVYFCKSLVYIHMMMYWGFVCICGLHRHVRAVRQFKHKKLSDLTQI